VSTTARTCSATPGATTSSSSRRSSALRRTQPPVAAIVDLLASLFAGRSLLVAIQIHETAVAPSIDELRSRSDWSSLTIYDIDPAGRNHGLLVGCLGWTPAVDH
jgi:hypothetical protein